MSLVLTQSQGGAAFSQAMLEARKSGFLTQKRSSVSGQKSPIALARSLNRLNKSQMGLLPKRGELVRASSPKANWLSTFGKTQQVLTIKHPSPLANKRNSRSNSNYKNVRSKVDSNLRKSDSKNIKLVHNIPN